MGASAYVVQPMDGSPPLSATSPLADFGFGDTLPSPGSMTGKVCLISRGNIAFADKVLNCQNSGGIGAIIYNNTTGDLFGTLGTGDDDPVGRRAAKRRHDDARAVGQSATVSVASRRSITCTYNGTSMATPRLGVAALVWSK